MNIELNELLREIHSWKNLLKQRNAEIERLQKQLSFSHKQNEILERSRANLLHEVGSLNNAVASLHSSYRNIEIIEADKQNLLEEKQKLKNSLESLEKLYYEKNKSLTYELQKVKEANKEETSKLLKQVKDEASTQVENMKVELQARENDIKDMSAQITNLLTERDQDILKIKIQYEDKISKLKQQIPKSKVLTSGMPMHDVFRQKYLSLKRDSEEEISNLKGQIHSLQLLMESLKPKSGSTSLSTALLASKVRNKEVSVQTEQTENFSMAVSEEDDINFVEKKKKFNKTQAVFPQKRKLFNLNANYFIK